MLLPARSTMMHSPLHTHVHSHTHKGPLISAQAPSLPCNMFSTHKERRCTARNTSGIKQSTIKPIVLHSLPYVLSQLLFPLMFSFNPCYPIKSGLFRCSTRLFSDLLQQITALKKENFNLKLRIYFMEERMQQKCEDSTEDIFKTVILQQVCW